MRVDVDEAGRDELALGVERLIRRGPAQIANLGDAVAANADVGANSVRAGAIDYGAISDEQVECHLLPSRRWAQDATELRERP